MNTFILLHMKRFLFLLVFICLYTGASAKSDTVKASLNGTSLAIGQSLHVSGTRYYSGVPAPITTRNYWVEKTYGLVKFSMPAGSQASTGTVTLTATISYVKEVNGVFVPTTETGVQLTIRAGELQATDAAYFMAGDVHDISVSVTALSASGLSGLELTASVITQSFDYMVYSDRPSGLIHTTTLTAGGSLPVSWTTVSKAEAYELEWTYISNQSADALTVKPFNEIQIPPFYFRNNSSRVEVTGTSYNIPLVYETGYILYRVRAVGKSIVNSMPVWVKSNWTYSDNGTDVYPESNAYLYAGLENNINWQSSLSFAEEGKHKVVVSYHDGSSRNRQAVTRINTDERAVIGETMYDYNGRPMIQTLPVPVKKDSLGFYPHFNVIDGKSLMLKEDAVYVTSDTCNPSGPKFSNQTGSSNYYSPSNSFGSTGNTGANIINKELIPDAKKYPYAQTIYTPDNTGRIAVQSGMGETNRAGSGHETKYLYATPLQAELCRLFGTQVGYAAHYKKNTVIDPNGQVSVSYLDLDGKVVATALAGNAPGNVQTLGNENTRVISEDLIGTNPMSNAISADSTARIFNKKFVVTSNSVPYTFSYTGSFGFYDIPCKASGSFTHIDGVVDVYMTLTDKCGTLIFNANPDNTLTMKTNAGNTGIRKTAFSGQINKTLTTGEYVLTKKAVINEEKLAAYTQDYLASTCAKKLEDFQEEERAKISLADCNLTCKTCEAERDTLLKSKLLTAEQKEDIVNMCSKICNNTIGCSASLNTMKGDMTPMGQYAEIRESRIKRPQSTGMTVGDDGSVSFSSMDNKIINTSNQEKDNAVHPELFPLSIFNADNKLPLGSYLNGLYAQFETHEYWRYPIKIRKGTTVHAENYQILNDPSNPITLTGVTYEIDEYRDSQGDTAFAYVEKQIAQDNSITYFPEITNPSKLTAVDEAMNLYKIPVRYLANIVDFEDAWKSHWAYALLPYHPEFPYYIECMAQAASNDFDYALMNTTFADAVTEGYLSATGVPAVYAKEGLANAHPALPGYSQSMAKSINENCSGQNISMALLANRMTNCLGVNQPTSCTPKPDCENTLINTEQEWSTYRSLYLSAKQQLLRTAEMIKAVDNNYYNGCIGHRNYTTIPEAWYFTQPKIQTVSGSSVNCSGFFGWKYSCRTENYTYNVSTYPYLMQSQICFAGNARYFETKSQRFYPTPNDDANTQQAGKCPEVSYNAAGKPLLALVPCEADLIAQNAERVTEAQRLKYELCGLCPKASDVESLLIKLASNNKLVTSAATLNCSDDNMYLGEALKNSITGSATANADITWSGSLSANKKIFTGLIKLTGATVYTVSLAIPAVEPYTFDQLLSVCCLSVTGSTGNAFTLRASFKQLNVYKDIWLNGTMNLDLTDCTIDPKCILTQDATNAVNLLNILSAKGHLTTGAGVSLFAGINDANDYHSNVNNYFDAVLSILRVSNENDPGAIAAVNTLNPVWTGNTDSNPLVSGTLDYTLNGNSYSMVIQVFSAGIPSQTTLTVTGNQQINLEPQFKNLKPLPVAQCGTECGIRFSASMISVSNNQFTSQPVIIKVPALQPVKCTVVIPGTVDRVIVPALAEGN